MNERIYWQGVSDHAAVLWMEETTAAGVAVITGPSGLVMWGSLTWQAMQDLGLSRLSHHRPGYPEWEQEQPPSWEALEREWKAGARARAASARRAADTAPAIAADLAARRGTVLTPKAPGETTESFYRRVASFYKATMERNGKPTQAIAESAGVPKTTAARWVREARRLTYLPPTSKGRSRA